MIVPESVVQPFLALRAVSDRHMRLPDQVVLARFIEEGHFARHLRRMRVLYSQRHENLVGLLRRHAKGLIVPQLSAGGLNIVGLLAHQRSDVEASNLLRAKGIDAPALSSFRLQHKGQSGLLLGYAAYDPASTMAAVRKMVRILSA